MSLNIRLTCVYSFKLGNLSANPVRNSDKLSSTARTSGNDDNDSLKQSPHE
ncbi:hypothetical protein AZE42_04518 [Rhizopogon vesiculosus]|uniref:Uncharacterized protein n=1 Tax=Rhizopogon vesiculosus TaxID=180088 RepID=A0A1J8Q044_9AGAM|nr:hypothetical protein AZE42_04518 [Rhizopogon vesiculosus]